MTWLHWKTHTHIPGQPSFYVLLSQAETGWVGPNAARWGADKRWKGSLVYHRTETGMVRHWMCWVAMGKVKIKSSEEYMKGHARIICQCGGCSPLFDTHSSNCIISWSLTCALPLAFAVDQVAMIQMIVFSRNTGNYRCSSVLSTVLKLPPPTHSDVTLDVIFPSLDEEGTFFLPCQVFLRRAKPIRTTRKYVIVLVSPSCLLIWELIWQLIHYLTHSFYYLYRQIPQRSELKMVHRWL